MSLTQLFLSLSEFLLRFGSPGALVYPSKIHTKGKTNCFCGYYKSEYWSVKFCVLGCSDLLNQAEDVEFKRQNVSVFPRRSSEMNSKR